jgi:hypothetical protein
VAPVKIVLVDLPRTLQEILLGVLRELPDLDIVDEVDTTECPDFLILGADGPELRGRYRKILFKCPATRVIAISPTGAQGFLHELRPLVTPLGQLTPEGIVELIRELSDPGSPYG